ncbi:MAG TPA: GNAT family N-acetyltransferase [Pseudonocardiaceae bacterium]|nr:GNAT family N-acetyltransferase [Pseudonocardiaceae bacterium]
MIRERRPEDLTACVAALAEVHAADAYPVRWQADPAGWLSQGRTLGAWVAEHDDRIAGHIALNAENGDACARVWAEFGERPAGVLCRLFVPPAARGFGLGAQLLARAAEHARVLGRQPVLEVLALNKDAIALYDRLGWRLLRTIDYSLHGEFVPMHCYAAPPVAGASAS